MFAWGETTENKNTAVHNPGPAVEQICSYYMSEHQLSRDPCIEPFNALSHSSHLLLWQYRAADSTESLNPAIEDKHVRILSEKLLLPSSH